MSADHQYTPWGSPHQQEPRFFGIGGSSRSSSTQAHVAPQLSPSLGYNTDAADESCSMTPLPSTAQQRLGRRSNSAPTLDDAEKEFSALQLKEHKSDLLAEFMSTVEGQVKQRSGALSPCTAADLVGRLNNNTLQMFDLVAGMAPSTIAGKLSNDLTIIAESIENMCRDFLKDVGYSFYRRPTGHMGRTYLWTTMSLLCINLLENSQELSFVTFLTRIYGENIAINLDADIKALSSVDTNKVDCLQRILGSWGSSLNLSEVSQPTLKLILSLFTGNSSTPSLLKFGHDACRRTYYLNGLSPRLLPQTPPLVKSSVHRINTMQDWA